MKLKQLFSRASEKSVIGSKGNDNSQSSNGSEVFGKIQSTTNAQPGPESLETTTNLSTDLTQLAAETSKNTAAQYGDALPDRSIQDPDIIHLTINNLIQVTNRHPLLGGGDQLPGRCEITLSVSKLTRLSELWSKIYVAGYNCPDKLADANGKQWAQSETKVVFEPFEEVTVIDGEPNDQASINESEPFIAFANRKYGRKTHWNIATQTAKDGKLVDCLEDTRGLWISFLRTIRMPDDGKLHALPAALGTFPLYNVSAYESSLPANIVREGGIFLPMWQREALWIGFHCLWQANYALRVSVGHINAISGSNIDERSDKADGHDPVQDYVVVPGQEWLDGICVGPGVVRQFVAMPLGSGYTVEGQKTGEEKHGGLQIEIIPSFEQGLRKWARSSAMPVESKLFDSTNIPWLKEKDTARNLGFKPGEVLRSYPSPAFHEVPVLISDIVDEDAEQVTFSAVDFPEIGDLYTSSARDDFARNSKSRMSKASKDVGPVSTDLQSMGLAAGGLLMQDIYKDNNPPETWNTSASKLINVHILNPLSCEKVTHIVPSPPPIDAETYAKADLPFYLVDERPDDRLEGGEFDNVNSVSALDKENILMEQKPLDPSILTECRCGVRLCDCIIRPCDHQFCYICIKQIDSGLISTDVDPRQSARQVERKCPVCTTTISHVAGFSAPMNLPGEESIKMRVPVHVLEVRDGRVAFKSIQKSRI